VVDSHKPGRKKGNPEEGHARPCPLGSLRVRNAVVIHKQLIGPVTDNVCPSFRTLNRKLQCYKASVFALQITRSDTLVTKKIAGFSGFVFLVEYLRTLTQRFGAK